MISGSLVWAVASLGHKPLPAELSPLKPRWDFPSAASPWKSTNSHLRRTTDGLMITPTAGAAIISSSLMDHDPAAFERMHLRLKVRDATQGRVGLVLRGRGGSSRVSVPFDIPVGETFTDIEVPLPVTRRPDVRVVEVVLVPSLAVQPAIIASLRFEPSGPWLATAVGELSSRLPGETLALSGFSMHTVPPPVIDGRSIWAVLMPLVLAAGTLTQLATGASRNQSVVRRVGFAIVVGVWGVGFLFVLYHQTIALGVEVQRFGDLNREAAYTEIDGVELWEDMSQVARQVPAGSAVEFNTSPGEDPAVSAFLKGRASYYLYPVLVRTPAPVKVLYFGGAHSPCEHIQSGETVLHEAARYCVFGAIADTLVVPSGEGNAS